MLYKNWPEICKFENAYFRLAVALSNNQEFLGRIAQAFPDLITEAKPEREGPFPLSYLKELATKWCTGIEGDEDVSTLYNCFNEVGMPAVLCAHPQASVFDEHCLPMPPHLSNEKRYAELSDEYQMGDNQNYFPYSLKTVEVNGASFYIGWVNMDGVRSDSDKDIYLYPIALVDANA